MADQVQAVAHWDASYAQGDDTRSWFEKLQACRFGCSPLPGSRPLTP
jgi:hypothetical protein